MSLEIKQFIEQMRNTSSALEKIEIIKGSSKFIHKVLEYTYNPFKQYHVTSKTCMKNAHLKSNHSLDLFEVLDKFLEMKDVYQFSV